MSFSAKVKEELAREIGSARHCQIAELAAMFGMCGRIAETKEGELYLTVRMENPLAADKFSSLLSRAFGIQSEPTVRGICTFFTVTKYEEMYRFLNAMKLIGEDGYPKVREDFVSSIVVQNACCRRAFLRGAFLTGGSVSNPEKSYHLEIVCSGEAKARQLQEMIASFDMEGKIVLRKNHFVVYMKEGSQIADMLGLMGANIGLMDLENVRILREMRGSVNRKVNCETANINKTVGAAVKQIQDIELIREKMGLEKLPEGLYEIAVARLEHPSDVTLKELGESLDPPVGKSGVNHRLRKLKELAASLRENEEEQL